MYHTVLSTWRFIKYSDAKAPKQANIGVLASEYFMNRQVHLKILGECETSSQIFAAQDTG